MDLNKYKVYKNIACIDLKSFYASVECALRGLDPFKVDLVVADKSRGDGSIVLAVSPALREKGVPSRLRIYELPDNIDIIYAKPRMEEYLKYAANVVNIYLDFVSKEDLFVYSIDEVFLDLTNYLKLYDKTPKEIVEDILNKIHKELKITATAGIGPNMLMAKLAMDLDSKTNESNIATWTYSDVKEKLWETTPLSKMWGIGSRMERNLNLLGLYKIGDIANYNKELLQKRFGVLGLELWYHTNGIDMSVLQEKDILRSRSKSFGSSQVLFKDYNSVEIKTIILEMTDEIVSRLRLSRKNIKTIKLSITYSKEYNKKFSHQITLDKSTQRTYEIYKNLIHIFDTYDLELPIRKVSITLSNITNAKYSQLTLFDQEDEIEKEFELNRTLDKLKRRYNNNIVSRAVSNKDHATAKTRNKQIGGHHV